MILYLILSEAQKIQKLFNNQETILDASFEMTRDKTAADFSSAAVSLKFIKLASVNNYLGIFPVTFLLVMTFAFPLEYGSD